MAITFDIVGVGPLALLMTAATLKLEIDLEQAVLEAAHEGVQEAQEVHPYTDRTDALTNSAEVIQASDYEADMVWPQDYASWVDQGTSRAQPYPFTPKAEARATEALDRLVRHAVNHFEDTLR